MASGGQNSSRASTCSSPKSTSSLEKDVEGISSLHFNQLCFVSKVSDVVFTKYVSLNFYRTAECALPVETLSVLRFAFLKLC